ncbi:PDK repeat-containing protein [Actinobacteria bacterium IMCC26207]|nr:PDK repeat-containing protein [Actinobacteria bacterium IMCC26207]
MNSLGSTTSHNRRRSLLSGRVKALIIAGALLAGAAVVNPMAGAQPVGNPGSLNLKIVDGTFVLGAQTFPLKPADVVECADGRNNDDGQDVVIDYPSDPQCTSLLDASEVQTGFQAKQDSTINGTVNAAGAVTIPQSGIFFPPVYTYAVGAVITFQIQPTGAGTGNLNPITGVASLNISVKISIQGAPQGQDLTSACGISPINLSFKTGTTNPPIPNEPISGVPYNDETGRATFVDNSFSAPGASGCATLGAANGPLNAEVGVPAASGVNTAIVVVEANPKVTKGVKASNVPSVSTGNAPLTVNFNGTGSTAVKTISSYAWDFGNGQTATGPTAFTTYSTPGTYQSKLTVTDSDGDKDVSTKTITVNVPPNVPPTAAIGSSGSGGLAPYAVTFDGSGSSDSDGSVSSYAWDFGNGRTATGAVASANYTAPGTYTTTLTVTDNRGATGTATKQTVVTGAPNIAPSAVITTVSVAGTVPLTVNLSGGNSSDADGSIATYAWDLGNGQTATGPSAQAVFSSIGSYTVTLVVTDDRGATSTQTLTINVSADSNIPPGAVISSDVVSGTAPLQVNFNGSGSSDVDGTIATYAWNFGNGQNGSGVTPPAATYTLPGTYTATLTVTDNKGATGSVSRTITVNRPPNQSPTVAVAATPSVGSAPLLVQLSSAGSQDADGAIAGYAWNFGNGTSSTNPNPSAIYDTPGTYTVSLTVTDNDGASAVKSTTVVVNPPNIAPVPSFTATPLTGSAPLLVNVNGAGSSDADGSVVSYAWNFGNGQLATGALGQTTFTTAGTYVIRLTVTDNRGTSRNTTVTVVAGAANARPIAVISALPTSGPAPLLVQLSAAGSTDTDGQITTYAWDFGDGRTASGLQTQVTYSTPGTYTVTLKLTDNRGATTSVTETVTVDPTAAASDRIKLQFVGGVNYTFDGKTQGGSLKITRDAFGIKSVTGTAPYAGAGNSVASVTVNLNRVLIFNAFLGTVVVSDATNGINDVSTSLFLTPLTSPSATSARGSGSGTTAGRTYNLLFTIDDRA